MDKLAELEKELLADMEENPVEYTETVNSVFEIDSNLRTINIPVTVKNIGVESDDDVKRLEFTMPKQYGEFDLSQFRIRINYVNANGDKSIYLVEDKKVSGDNITFSWLIGRDVTKYKGQVNFIVCLKLSDAKGKILKELNTTLCRLEVLEGLEVVPVIDEKTTDIIEQLLRMVETETTGAVQKVTEEGNKQVKEVQKAAQEIAADREQIQKNAESATALKEDLKLIDTLTLKTTINKVKKEILCSNKGFLDKAGNVYTGSENYDSYMHSDLITVKEGDRIEKTDVNAELRTVVAYNNGKAIPSLSKESVTLYDVPNDVDGIKIVMIKGSSAVLNTTENTKENIYDGEIKNINKKMSNLPLQNLDGIELTGYNYFLNVSKKVVGKYAYSSIGQNGYEEKPSNVYSFFELDVSEGEYTISNANIRFLTILDETNVCRKHYSFEEMRTEYSIIITENSKIICTVETNTLNVTKISKNGRPTEEEYIVYKRIKFDSLVENQKIHAYLPKYIYVAVGRTIEIYNNQMCLEADKYHIQWVCDIGKALKRKFSITGKNIGDFILKCNIYDDEQNVIWDGQTTIKVVKNTFTSNHTCVPIGDSLTNNKNWSPEVITLSNNRIKYVGHYSANIVDANGTLKKYNHEGRSGFRVNSYLLGSPYTYGSGDETEHNVFWDGTRFNWKHYKETVNVNPDFVQIFLGANDLSDDNTFPTSRIKQMIDLIRQDDATIPIFVVNTIYFANQNGIGNQTASDGYSAALKGMWKFNKDMQVMDFMKKLDTVLNDMANVHMINLALTHDTEYNFGNIETPVNPRASQKEFMPTEGVHPQKQGYFQMADVIFSTYCGVLD